jgi:hypothetical protein
MLLLIDFIDSDLENQTLKIKETVNFIPQVIEQTSGIKSEEINQIKDLSSVFTPRVSSPTSANVKEGFDFLI